MAPPDFANLAERTGAILLACKFLGEVEMARKVSERKDPSGFQSPFKSFASKIEAKLINICCSTSRAWHLLGIVVGREF